MTKSQRYKRKAMARIFLVVFVQMQSLGWALARMTHEDREVLSEKELAYVNKLAKMINDDANKVLDFGHRLER